MTLFDSPPPDELERAQREIRELEALCQALIQSVADLIATMEALIREEEGEQTQALQA